MNEYINRLLLSYDNDLKEKILDSYNFLDITNKCYDKLEEEFQDLEINYTNLWIDFYKESSEKFNIKEIESNTKVCILHELKYKNIVSSCEVYFYFDKDGNVDKVQYFIYDLETMFNKDITSVCNKLLELYKNYYLNIDFRDNDKCELYNETIGMINKIDNDITDSVIKFSNNTGFDTIVLGYQLILYGSNYLIQFRTSTETLCLFEKNYKIKCLPQKFDDIRLYSSTDIVFNIDSDLEIERFIYKDNVSFRELLLNSPYKKYKETKTNLDGELEIVEEEYKDLSPLEKDFYTKLSLNIMSALTCYFFKDECDILNQYIKEESKNDEVFR